MPREVPLRQVPRTLSNFSVRFGIHDVFDTPPPSNDDSASDDEGNPRGRMFYAELSKQF